MESDARRAWFAVGTLLLSNEMQQTAEQVARASGLRQTGSLRALLTLDDEPRPMRGMATALQCDASYVTGLVDDLEGAGYVERRPSPTDRRVKLVTLTEAGRRARDTARHALGEPPAFLARLSDADHADFARVMDRVMAALDAERAGRAS